MPESVDAMYNKEGVPTDGCNLEIMDYPFYAENVSPNEAFRRREYTFNSIVGGTQYVTPGAYVGLDFSITTHVFIDPDRPDEWNAIFQEMMSKPVEVVSPELGGRFNAIVVIKPERDKLNTLKLTISIKEVPGKNSLIPGEEFIVPKSKKVQVKRTTDKSSSKGNTSSNGKSNSNGKTNSKGKSGKSKKTKSVSKKSKSKSKSNSK